MTKKEARQKGGEGLSLISQFKINLDFMAACSL